MYAKCTWQLWNLGTSAVCTPNRVGSKMFNPGGRLFFTSSVWQKCLEFTKPKSSDINKRESRYTIKALIEISQNQAKILTYLIAIVELYIKVHKYNSLMNTRRIVIINIVKLIQKLQAWSTWWIKQLYEFETLFPYRKLEKQSFFRIKHFSIWTIFLVRQRNNSETSAQNRFETFQVGKK